MSSPFEPGKQEPPPFWRIAAWLLILGAVGFITAWALGYVHLQFGKKTEDARAEKQGDQPKKGVERPAGKLPFLRRDEDAEKVLLLFDDRAVFRSQGAILTFRVETEADGVKKTLGESPPFVGKGKSTKDVKGLAVLVRRGDALEAVLTVGEGSRRIGPVTLAGVKDEKGSLREDLALDEVADLKSRVGDEIELYRVHELEAGEKKDSRPLRTIRLLAKVVAVQLED